MVIIKQNLGVDVDSKKLKTSFMVLYSDQSIKVRASRTFDNTSSGFLKMQEWVESKKVEGLPIHLTMEATGVYYENLTYFFQVQDQYIVHVELPNKTSAYFKSLNLKSKTDEIDAQALARFGLERKLEEWNPGSLQMRQIKKLTRERVRLLKEKTMVSNQLHAENNSYESNQSSVIRYNERIDFIDNQVKQIERETKKLVTKDCDLQERLNNVCTIKGVAFITAISVIAETDGFTLFNNRSQLVSYAGYDVVQRQSGTSIKGKTRISKRGNSNIRSAMYMGAMSAILHDEHHRNYALRIVKKTGIRMKGNVAIQRKLLVLIYALYKKNVPYDPAYHNQLRIKLRAKKGEHQVEKCRQDTNPAYAG